MRLPILALMAFSLVACSSAVPRPNSLLCVVNVPALHEKCYNLKTDYDDNGQLKKDAQAKIKQYTSRDEMLNALNKRTDMAEDDWAGVKGYMKELRKEWDQTQVELSHCNQWGGG